MAIKQTADYEPYTGYTTYEGGDFPRTGWTYSDEQGGWIKPKANPNTPSQFTLEDIKNRSSYAFDPYQDKLVSDGVDASLDPNAYYNQLATDLVDSAFNRSAINSDASEFNTLIEGLKDVNPQAYYKAKIDYLSRQAGQNYMANEMGRMETIQKQLQDILPAAQQAGVTPDQINATYGSGFSTGGQTMQQIIANQQEQGGSLKPLVEGIKFVGPGLLGMYGIDSALTAGLGAAYGAGTGMATTGIGSGLGGAAAMEGGALASSLGSLGGGGFGLTGASGAAGAMGSGSSLQLAPTYMGVGSGVGGGITAPSLATGLGVGSGGVLGSGALSAESIAAMEAMNAGSGYGLNASQVPSLTSGLELGATQGLSTSDILSNVNRARSGANTLAKLIGGSSGSTAGTTGGTTGGVNTQQLASLLALPTQAAPGGLYRMNQNPFNFGTQGQTVASQGMYDVSGTNPMANALRKA